MKKIVSKLLILMIIISMSVTTVNASQPLVAGTRVQYGVITMELNSAAMMDPRLSYVLKDASDTVVALGVADTDVSTTVNIAIPDTAVYGTFTLKVNSAKCSPETYSIHCTPAIVEDSFKLTSDSKLMVMQQSEASLTASWESETPYNRSVNLKVTDYYGNVVYNSSQSTLHDSIEFDLSDIGVGHFNAEAILDGDYTASTPFAVTVDKNKRKDGGSEHIAADTAASYHVRKEYFDDFAEAVSLCGIDYVRDRFHWTNAFNINGNTDEYNFGDFKSMNGEYISYDELLNAYLANDISVLGMISGVPSHAKPQSDYASATELAYLYNFTKAIGTYYGDKVDTWEIWNEPDIVSKNAEGPERYAAHLKAAAAGFKAADPDKRIAISGLAQRYPEQYNAQVFTNDIGDYFDVFNYHMHSTANSDVNVTPYLTAQSKQHIIQAEDNGYTADKEIWVTEAGIYEAYEDPEYEYLSYDAQIRQARFAPTSIIESLSLGTDKHFWFLLAPYSENNGNFGTFAPDYTPYAAYSSLAAITYVLGDMDYAGEYKCQGVNAHAFTDGSESVIALWSEDEVNCDVAVGKKSATMYDIMGTATAVTSEDGIYNLNVGPDITYIKVYGELPEQAVTKACPKAEKEIQTLSDNHRIILQPFFDDSVSGEAKLKGYVIPDGSSQTVTLRVYNFNAESKTVDVTSHAYGGFAVSPAEQSVTVAPGEYEEISFTLDTATAYDGITLPLKFSGECDGEPVSDTVCRVLTDGEIDAELIQTFSGSGYSWNWTQNTIAETKSITGTWSDGVKFSYTFSDTTSDRWAYPYISVNADDISDFGGGIVFDGYVPDGTDPSGIKWRAMVVDTYGNTYYNATPFQAASGWNTVYIPWNSLSLYNDNTDAADKFNPEKIKTLRLGIAYRGSDLTVTYNIKNLGVYNGGRDYGSAYVTADANTITAEFTEGTVPLKTDNVRILVNNSEYITDMTDFTSVYEHNLLSDTYRIKAIALDEGNAPVAALMSNALIGKNGLYVTSYDFTDADGNSLNFIGDNNTTRVKASVTNTSDTQNVTFAAAAYNAAGSLTDASMSTMQITNGNYADYDITLDTADAVSVKLFIWDGEGTLTPIALSRELN